MNKKLIALVLSATVFCSTQLNASASDITEQNGLVYVPDHSVFFIDVDENQAWAIQAIDYLANAQIINGKEHCVYSPNESITRADFITMLGRAFNMNNYATEENFPDVKEDMYYTKAISAAKNLSIAKGDKNGNFNPSLPLSREDAIVMLKRTLEKTGIKFKNDILKTYNDHSKISDYAVDAIYSFTNSKLVYGVDDQIKPKNSISRAQMAVMLYRALMLEENGFGDPIYTQKNNIVNLCVGNNFYPNVSITNGEQDSEYKGLYNCIKLYNQGDDYYAELGQKSDMTQQIEWKDNVLYVDGKVMNVSEEMSSICLNPYSVISNEPISTGKDYTLAAVSIQNDIVTAIYYDK